MIPIRDDNPSHTTPVVTLVLIAINCAVFFLWQAANLERSIEAGAFVPAEWWHGGVVNHLDELFLSMFMHGSLMHLAGNMWFLWLFGNNIEDACGSIRFLLFYLLCGAAATLAFALVNANSTVPLVGASGAISGVLGGYIATFPNARVLVWMPRGGMAHWPAWTFLGLWIGFQVLSQFVETSRADAGQGGGVAFLAHIAGFVAGLALIHLFRDGSRRGRAVTA